MTIDEINRLKFFMFKSIGFRALVTSEQYDRMLRILTTLECNDDLKINYEGIPHPKVWVNCMQCK